MGFNGLRGDTLEAENVVVRSVIETVYEGYAGTGSKQALAIDFAPAAGAGGAGKTLAAIMGHLTPSAAMTANAIRSGVHGKYNVPGTVGTDHPTAGVIGEVGESVAARAASAFTGVIGGDSGAVIAHAIMTVDQLNSTAGSGADYGVDLYGRTRAHDGYLGFAILKALERSPNEVCRLEGSGAPTDGGSGTGANFAGKGSTYTDYTNGKLYINTNTKASPTWTVVGTQT